jgi:hypothetical protein
LFGKKAVGLKNIPLRKLTGMNTITICLRRIAILPGLLFISCLALCQQDQEAYKTHGEMGNRYQQSTFAGDFMGQPVEGMGTLAYDNAKKQFESTWTDNMGCGIVKTTGREIRFTRKMDNHA